MFPLGPYWWLASSWLAFTQLEEGFKTSEHHYVQKTKTIIRIKSLWRITLLQYSLRGQTHSRSWGETSLHRNARLSKLVVINVKPEGRGGRAHGARLGLSTDPLQVTEGKASNATSGALLLFSVHFKWLAPLRPPWYSMSHECNNNPPSHKTWWKQGPVDVTQGATLIQANRVLKPGQFGFVPWSSFHRHCGKPAVSKQKEMSEKEKSQMYCNT